MLFPSYSAGGMWRAGNYLWKCRHVMMKVLVYMMMTKVGASVGAVKCRGVNSNHSVKCLLCERLTD